MESWDAGRHEQTRHSSMSQAFYVTGKGRESERVVSPCWLPADMTQTPPGRDVMNLKWMQSHIFTEILLPSFALFIFLSISIPMAILSKCMSPLSSSLAYFSFPSLLILFHNDYFLQLYFRFYIFEGSQTRQQNKQLYISKMSWCRTTSAYIYHHASGH